jgi:hypothetical protein
MAARATVGAAVALTASLVALPSAYAQPTFERTDITVGGEPRSVAFGEFNSDGNADLVVADAAGDSVRVLLGDGSGGFTPQPAVPVGNNPRSVAVADFDGDGNDDVVGRTRDPTASRCCSAMVPVVSPALRAFPSGIVRSS